MVSADGGAGTRLCFRLCVEVAAFVYPVFPARRCHAGGSGTAQRRRCDFHQRAADGVAKGWTANVDCGTAPYSTAGTAAWPFASRTDPVAQIQSVAAGAAMAARIHYLG